MPKRHTERVLHSSARSDWRTPPVLYLALNLEFSFTLDVAADDINHLGSHWFGAHGAEEDGLAADWAGVCFMNPPYDKQHPIGPWIRKAWSESQQGCTVVGVLPFSPQTRWYRQYVYGQALDPRCPDGCDCGGEHWSGHAAMEERRLTHRVAFLRPDGTKVDDAPGNTVIIVWRPNPGYVGPWQPAVRYWSYR